MKILLSLIFIISSFFSFGQYSNYYSIYKKVDVNQNVNISGNINTIDYGSLALANAQREKNRLEAQKYSDEKSKEIAISIANNPMLAYDYGTAINVTKKNDKDNLFKKYTYNLRMPHPSLFTHLKGGDFENVSYDGVKTEITIFLPIYNKDKVPVDVEKNQKNEEDTVGQIQRQYKESQSTFLHKKDIDRATVFSIPGYRGTLIWEDDYDFAITDNYQSYSDDGILYNARVRYSGSKKEINFEKIEGRRFYLRRVIEKIISTASITDYKVMD